MPALLEIDEYSIDSVSLQVNPDFDGEKEYEAALDVDFNIGRDSTGEPRFEIRLFIGLNLEDEQFTQSPCRFHLEIAGYFHFQEGTDEETIKKMITPNGLSILYGIARGAVGQMTGNTRYGKIVLPSFNFMELIQEKSREKKRSSQDKSRKKTANSD